MAKDYSIGVITNDIYTKEDAQFLAKNSVLPVERIIGVETGGWPHTRAGNSISRSFWMASSIEGVLNSSARGCLRLVSW